MCVCVCVCVCDFNIGKKKLSENIVFTKLNVKSHFVPLSGTCTCRQGNCYNRSPMWPSLGFKPFSTKKLHGFIYMMSLDIHLNNSLSFSSCVASHHHWHKSTV